MRKIVLSLSVSAILAMTSYASSQPHWDYDANGPARWSEFSGVCKDGKAQSPIDLITTDTKPMQNNHLIKINADMQSNHQIVDNGHAIQVNIENGGSTVVDGVEYKLLQFHFHGKSEEMINGKQYDFDAHMVHKSVAGDLLVVGVLFQEGSESSPIIDKIIKNVGTTAAINPAELLPKDTEHYYHFMGSLTTPPCSENVRWYIMKEPKIVTKEQIMALRKFYDNNYRPVQPLNGRIIESK